MCLRARALAHVRKEYAHELKAGRRNSSQFANARKITLKAKTAGILTLFIVNNDCKFDQNQSYGHGHRPQIKARIFLAL